MYVQCLKCLKWLKSRSSRAFVRSLMVSGEEAHSILTEG